MNKIFGMISAIMLSLILANCSRKRDRVTRLNSDVCESMDYDSVVAIYEHIDSVTGEVSMLPFDSLYPAEQDRIYKSDSQQSFEDETELSADTDPIWYVHFDSLKIKDKPLSYINMIYGNSVSTNVDTLRFGMYVTAGGDGAAYEYEDDYVYDMFKKIPFAIVTKKVWRIDPNHDLILYFRNDKDDDPLPFDGSLGINWFE